VRKSAHKPGCETSLLVATFRIASQRAATLLAAALRITTQRALLRKTRGTQMQRIATATLISAAPYSQSRSYSHEVEALPRETKEAYEERTWRNKCHTMPDGRVFIPPMAFKMSLDRAVQVIGRQVPGKGKATYTKFFVSGVLVMEPVPLPQTKEDVACDRIHANSDGVRGSGKRVWRNFPRFDNWKADVNFYILADEITEDVFDEALRQSGAFVGIGRFRPEKGGFYGRFEVADIKWH
jgi:hypothetical protein